MDLEPEPLPGIVILLRVPHFRGVDREGDPLRNRTKPFPHLRGKDFGNDPFRKNVN
jgi:hypothetical protein